MADHIGEGHSMYALPILYFKTGHDLVESKGCSVYEADMTSSKPFIVNNILAEVYAYN
jgi:hypothetical protein